MADPQAIIALAANPSTMAFPEEAHKAIMDHCLREQKFARGIYVLAKPAIAEELRARNCKGVIPIGDDDVQASKDIQAFIREHDFHYVLLVACAGALRPWREWLEKKGVTVLREFATSRGYL